MDEKRLRNVMPELNTTTAIQAWIQQMIDFHIKEMDDENEETMDIEEARAMIHETIRKEYALI